MSTTPSASLRLGVLCAVIERDQLLLSRRGDLNVWTLPGGRLDSRERLSDAAGREVREETGLTVQVEEPLALYYLEGWQRMNILYRAVPHSGKLRRTDETRDNRYFPVNELPAMPLPVIAQDVTAIVQGGQRPLPRIIETSPAEMRRLRLRLGWRYVWNAVWGRPEPKFPEFNVSAVAVIWNETTRRVLTLRGKGDLRMLPRLMCDGMSAPWQQLAAMLAERTGIEARLNWAGVWQDAARNRIELVFSAVLPSGDLFRTGEWSSARNTAFENRDALYLARVKPAAIPEPVWTIDHALPSVKPGDTIFAARR